jgi:hypothetical protein
MSTEYTGRQVKDHETEAIDGGSHHRRRSWSSGDGYGCRRGQRRSRSATTRRQPWGAARGCSWRQPRRASTREFPWPGRARTARSARSRRTRWAGTRSRRTWRPWTPRTRRTGWTRTRRAGRTWRPWDARARRTWRSRRPMAWRRPARLLPRRPVGRWTRTLGTGCTTAAGLEPTPPTARRTVGLWPHQLLGLPGKPLLESAVQPVGLRLLRSLDSAVTSHLTRRPLRQSARRALWFVRGDSAVPLFATDSGVIGARIAPTPSTGPGNSAPRSRCKTWRLTEAQFHTAHKPSLAVTTSPRPRRCVLRSQAISPSRDSAPPTPGRQRRRRGPGLAARAAVAP